MTSKRGFTLVEFILYIAMFGIISVVFTSLFFVATRVQVRETTDAEVNNQGNLVLQTIQRLISSSSTVAAIVNSTTSISPKDQDSGTGGTSLVLRLRSIPSDTKDNDLVNDLFDPIQIYKNNYTFPSGITAAAVVIKKGTGPEQPLTTDAVNVTGLTFVKHQTPPGHDLITVNLTLAYNNPQTGSAVSRTVFSTIGRVSAAQFDDRIFPNLDNNYDLGTGAFRWKDGYFSGDTRMRSAIIDRAGASRPGCDSTIQGMIWVTQGVSGVGGNSGLIEICIKDKNGVFHWDQVYKTIP